MNQVLTQDEINSLLRGLSDGDIEQDDIEMNDEGANAKKFDLANQERIIRGRMPTLDIINQMFSRLFRSTFSALMRKSVDIRAVSTDTIKFGDFLRSSYPRSNTRIISKNFNFITVFTINNKLFYNIV